MFQIQQNLFSVLCQSDHWGLQNQFMTQKRYLKTLLRFLGIYNQQTFYNVLYIFTYKRDSSLQQLDAFNFDDDEF